MNKSLVFRGGFFLLGLVVVCILLHVLNTLGAAECHVTALMNSAAYMKIMKLCVNDNGSIGALCRALFHKQGLCLYDWDVFSCWQASVYVRAPDQHFIFMQEETEDTQNLFLSAEHAQCRCHFSGFSPEFNAIFTKYAEQLSFICSWDNCILCIYCSLTDYSSKFTFEVTVLVK